MSLNIILFYVIFFYWILNFHSLFRILFQVQGGIYTGPFILKQLIEKKESLPTCVIDQLQHPMIVEHKLSYAQGIKSLLKHNVNVTPISYGLIPMITNAWPNLVSESFGIDQNSSFPEFGSSPQISKNNKYYGSNLNEVQWKASNTPPQIYQHSEEWLDKDVFIIPNAPKRQSLPLDISRIIPSCIYSNIHLEQPLISVNPFGRERHQNTCDTFEQTELNRNIKEQRNNNIFHRQV